MPIILRYSYVPITINTTFFRICYCLPFIEFPVGKTRYILFSTFDITLLRSLIMKHRDKRPLPKYMSKQFYAVDVQSGHRIHNPGNESLNLPFNQCRAFKAIISTRFTIFPIYSYTDLQFELFESTYIHLYGVILMNHNERVAKVWQNFSRNKLGITYSF